VTHVNGRIIYAFLLFFRRKKQLNYEHWVRSVNYCPPPGRPTVRSKAHSTGRPHGLHREHGF
jgi:hypothetical protein